MLYLKIVSGGDSMTITEMEIFIIKAQQLMLIVDIENEALRWSEDMALKARLCYDYPALLKFWVL